MRNFFIIIFLLGSIYSITAQSFNTAFGKNRIQYNDDFKYWSQYETDHFIVYWYGKGKNIAHTVIQMAELDHEKIRKEIEHRLSDKIEILVYVDLEDFNQSNIGSEELIQSETGVTKVVGNKILVYFDGNHLNLRNRIKQGIASVYFASMYFGSNFQEIVQNAVLLDLPNWYKNGFVSYAAEAWSTDVENELRDILASNSKYYQFKKIAGDYPKVAGHSLWYFLRKSYGRSTISNLLYLTRISRDLDKSVEFSLNITMKQLQEEWSNFYKTKFENDQNLFAQFPGVELKLKNKKNVIISSISFSPDQKVIAYATNQLSKVKVYLYDIKSGESNCIFKYGVKNRFQESNYNYPHIAWNEMGTDLTFTFPKKDRIFIRKYQVENKKSIEQVLPEEIQIVHTIDYVDSRYYMLNATVDGYSDLLLYDAKERESLPITNDFYDDLDAVVTYINGEKSILFASNRTQEHIIPAKIDTILPVHDFDIFYYPLPLIDAKYDLKSIPRTIGRITQEPDENERQPMVLDNQVIYLSDRSGINNVWITDVQNYRPLPLTNVSRNIITHHTIGHQHAYITFFNNKFRCFYSKEFNTHPDEISVTEFKQKAPTVTEPKEPAVQYIEIPEALKFQSEFSDPSPTMGIVKKEEKNIFNSQIGDADEKNIGFIEKINHVKIGAAGLKFKFSKLTAKLDNNVLFEGLELATGQNDEVRQIPMGFLAKAAVADIFEDYLMEVGTRISSNLDGAEYFVNFDNEKTKIDKRFGIYYRRYTEKPLGDFVPPLISKKQIIAGIYRLKFPFNTYQCVTATASLRMDKQWYKSSEQVTLDQASVSDKRVGLRFEYIYDNSFENSVNILHGSRVKAFVEGYNQFNFEIGNNTKVDLSKGTTFVTGIDARHYIPILNHSIIALRGTSAFSFGSKPNIYYLGDINNTVIPSFNNDIPLPQDREFAFKANEPHLRGFKSNIRNGSNYAFTNIELRVPFVKYMIGKESGKSFIRDIQVIGFFDAGLAWYGSGPFDPKNPLNSVFVDGPVIDLQIQYFRDPLIYSYGYGVRTKLFGYFLRFDVGHGIDTKVKQPVRYHLGLGLDF